MKNNYEPKEKFIERMKILLSSEEDKKNFFETAKTKPKKSIRVNTLKISPDKLKKILEKKGWKIREIKDHPEIIIIDSDLMPGELGKTKEHILGYYYVQEITSMMPIIALNPKPGEILLDLCAAPGSKTTQAAALMKNQGTIIANDLAIGRISILSSNLEKCGVTNTIVTRHDATEFVKKFQKLQKNYNEFKNFYFDKILLDAPCSGEGNIRLSPRTYLEWSESLIENLSRKQKRIAENAIQLLKINGEMIYSTCTHSPEENEEIINHLLEKFDIEILNFNLPVKSRPGITEWKNKKFSNEIKKAKRLYHHDNDMEGFFLCKIKKRSDKIK